MTTVHYT